MFAWFPERIFTKAEVPAGAVVFIVAFPNPWFALVSIIEDVKVPGQP
jgi:hypothetical protein